MLHSPRPLQEANADATSFGTGEEMKVAEFVPVQLALVDLESLLLNHTAKLSLEENASSR